MDLEYLDRVWTERKINALLFGTTMPDTESQDGMADVPRQSWYQIRCSSMDTGNPDMVYDAIQLERAINLIADHKVRAAMILAMHGWDVADIGAACGDYRTGQSLVRQGVRAIARQEQIRSELRG